MPDRDAYLDGLLEGMRWQDQTAATPDPTRLAVACVSTGGSAFAQSPLVTLSPLIGHNGNFHSPQSKFKLCLRHNGFCLQTIG